MFDGGFVVHWLRTLLILEVIEDPESESYEERNGSPGESDEFSEVLKVFVTFVEVDGHDPAYERKEEPEHYEGTYLHQRADILCEDEYQEH